jgi:hypothetical protein
LASLRDSCLLRLLHPEHSDKFSASWYYDFFLIAISFATKLWHSKTPQKPFVNKAYKDILVAISISFSWFSVTSSEAPYSIVKKFAFKLGSELLAEHCKHYLEFW